MEYYICRDDDSPYVKLYRYRPEYMKEFGEYMGGLKSEFIVSFLHSDFKNITGGKTVKPGECKHVKIIIGE